MLTTENNTPLEILEEFILEKAACEPIHRQLLIYRSLAAQVSDQHLKDDLNGLAKDLEAAQQRQRKLLLIFRTKNSA